MDNSEGHDRREFWKKHWKNVQEPSLSSGKNVGPSGMWEKTIEQNWDPLIKAGKSPQDVWQTRFKELSEHNMKFEAKKMPEDEKGRWNFKQFSSEDWIKPIEQVALLFMKETMQDMQWKWETQMKEGKTPEEFWSQEKDTLTGERFWRRGRGRRWRCRERKTGVNSEIFQEFDF